MKTYLVPEYYKNFKCKCGDCRHTCCYGWLVRISMKEYHRLLGVNCNKKLRDKLDCALKVCTRDVSPESYAQITTNYQGMCSLNREDGLCSLQVELGESILPDICRLYPRNPRSLSNLNLCSCSNSCEAVIEILQKHQSVMGFEELTLPMNPQQHFKTFDNHQELNKLSISIMQDRTHPLKERILLLGQSLLNQDIPTKQSPNIPWDMLSILCKYYEDSLSLEPYALEIQNYYTINANMSQSEEDLVSIGSKHTLASDYFETLFPDWEILFEQLLVNHMFYHSFPYIDIHSLEESYYSLVITYGFLRFQVLGFMYRKEDDHSYIDFLSALFRLFEHSDFNQKVLSICQRYHYDPKDYISSLVLL